MPTVSPDSGTIEVLDQTVETPKEPAKEEVKAPSLSEVEKLYQADFDKKHGRDIQKMFPTAAPKKEEPKPDAKVETKAEPAKEEPKPEAKPRSGFQRAMARKNREIGELTERSRQLEDRLKALEGGRATPAQDKVVVDAPKEPVKPKRADCKTTEEYLDLLDKYTDDIRAYDKAQITGQTKTELAKRDQTEQEREATEKFNRYIAKRDEVAKTIPDWDEVMSKSADIQFKNYLSGMLVDVGVEDPKLYYDMLKAPKEAKHINDLTEASVGAIGTVADNVPAMLRHLMKNPADIARLNTLDGPKAAKFIGILESKLEAEPSQTEKPKESAPLPASNSGTQPKAEAAKEEPARRQKPEPPPKVSGSAPPPSDWKDPQGMTIAERERLMREDPRFKRR